MILFNMAFNNIKKNFKNYWAFFLSSAFSVFVLYLFLSILYNKNIQTSLGDMNKFITLFLIGSYLTAFFSAFFIWYSNSFFIKSRKKEFATYMLLGMSKKQTVFLNFIENLLVMVLAFCAGIVLGLIFNKFFIMLLFVIIRATGTVQFQLSLKSLKYTLAIFGAVFAIISFHSSILIYKGNLVDLFNASKKAEKCLRFSLLTVIISLLSIVFIAYGYYLAAWKLAANFLISPVVVLLVVIGTLLFFTGTASLLLYVNKKNEKSLFSGTKLISTTQLYYRYSGNVSTLSVIAVSTTIALCAMLVCYGSFSKAEENSRYMRPFSIEYINTDSNTDKIFQDTLQNHKEISVRYKDNIEYVQVKAKDPLRGNEDTFLVLNESEFDKVNSHENADRKAGLKGENYCYFIQYGSFVPDKSVIGKNVILNTGNKDYSMKIADTDMKPFVALDHFKQTFIVKDNVYEEIKNSAQNTNIFKITGYILKNDFTAKNFILDLEKKIPAQNNVLTFYDHYMGGIKLLGMMAFIGMFIGLLFLTATGSIIYFKMSMEAGEDKNKYITLRKIGVSKKEITKAVSKELLILFGAPFIIAASNTYAASIPFSKMMNIKFTKEYMIIILIYAVLFSIYYFITLNSYVKTVSE